MAIDFKEFIKRIENAELRQQLRELEQDEQEQLKIEQLKLNNELKRARLKQLAKPAQKTKTDKTILITLIFCFLTCITPIILLIYLILLYN